jgi:hypothetical protein
MRRSYSTTEFREWSAETLTRTHRIGATFPTVLAKMGAIETDWGMVKLTPRMEGLRASTVRKQMNEYAHGYRKTRTAPKVKAPVETESINFNHLVMTLKAKLKQEVMAELLQSLK